MGRTILRVSNKRTSKLQKGGKKAKKKKGVISDFINKSLNCELILEMEERKWGRESDSLTFPIHLGLLLKRNEEKGEGPASCYECAASRISIDKCRGGNVKKPRQIPNYGEKKNLLRKKADRRPTKRTAQSLRESNFLPKGGDQKERGGQKQPRFYDLA